MRNTDLYILTKMRITPSTQDKKSLIKNDANDWAREHHSPA